MPNTKMLAGHARLPNGMAVSDLHETLTVTIEVDHNYGVIVWADCTLATDHAQSYLGNLLKGFSLRDGIQLIEKEIENHYYGKAKSALLAAVRDAYKQYQTPHVVK
ncbi:MULTISPECIES: DUF3870 domain-containing protein [Pseudalkalibacillus]|uniref:DUF3870 domain-containing protein n=1 Tax=Pseudalkalibacillus TaxID=2893058 RepID=UPI001CD37D74|nr:DUF3870 domain-containing protein [Pseudalkalibacillus salsuginis]MCF6409940.1 DUF3870 domain-containing protein [Pseudalkalibacillus salsuginis]